MLLASFLLLSPTNQCAPKWTSRDIILYQESREAHIKNFTCSCAHWITPLSELLTVLFIPVQWQTPIRCTSQDLTAQAHFSLTKFHLARYSLDHSDTLYACIIDGPNRTPTIGVSNCSPACHGLSLDSHRSWVLIVAFIASLLCMYVINEVQK